MQLIRELSEYIERLTGAPPAWRPVPEQRLRGLPVFLARASHFHEWTWMNQCIVLAQDDGGLSDLTPSEIKARLHLLMDHFKQPVAFVCASLAVYQRNRLVKLGVPFIIPGLQLFLPPFASLTEQFQRIVRADALSASAQATLLYQILRHPADGALLSRWAEWLGYSAMTMTKVRDELVGVGVCGREPGAKPRGLRFLHRGRALWDAAQPFLRSPIRATSWARIAKRPSSLIPAGLTALAQASLIQDDPLPTYACRDSEWKRLIETRGCRAAEHPDDANARVERWRYDPGLLAADGVVDRLSLYLGLAGAGDERVRLAAQSLLESVSW